LQLFRAAGDLFDDLEDNDFQGTAIAVVRPGIAINVATMLLILAEKALLRLGNRGVNASTISQVIDIINTAYEKACIGQHLDLWALRRKMLTEKAYLKIAELKTATSVECACRTGALVAGADNELIDKFALLGNNLGMASQIANDIQGILSLKDVLKPKMTLPVIFTLSQSEASVRDRLSRVFRQAEMLVKEARQIRRIIIEAGAVQYATIKLEYYKLRAWDYLHEIEATGAKIDQLKILFK
jgi:geranylgeranyl pyrophosphate synthase